MYKEMQTYFAEGTTVELLTLFNGWCESASETSHRNSSESINAKLPTQKYQDANESCTYYRNFKQGKGKHWLKGFTFMYQVHTASKSNTNYWALQNVVFKYIC